MPDHNGTAPAMAPTAQDPYPWIDISLLEPDPDNLMGEQMRDEEIEPLVLSIDSWIEKSPLTVYPTAEGRFRIWLGHHRFEAARRAQRAALRCCVVEPPSRTDQILEQLRENLNRRQESPLVIARKLNRLMEHEGLSVRMVAGKLGRDKMWISRHLALLRMPPEVQRFVASRALSIVAITSLLRLPADQVLAVATKSAEEAWPLERLESEVHLILHPPRKRRRQQDHAPAGSSPEPVPSARITLIQPDGEPRAEAPQGTSEESLLAAGVQRLQRDREAEDRPATGAVDQPSPPARITLIQPDGEPQAEAPQGTSEESLLAAGVQRLQRDREAGDGPAAGAVEQPSQAARPQRRQPIGNGTPGPRSTGAKSGASPDLLIDWLTNQFQTIKVAGKTPALIVAADEDQLFLEAGRSYPNAAIKFVATYGQSGPAISSPTDLEPLAQAWEQASPETRDATIRLLSHQAGREALRALSPLVEQALSGDDAHLLVAERSAFWQLARADLINAARIDEAADRLWERTQQRLDPEPVIAAMSDAAAKALGETLASSDGRTRPTPMAHEDTYVPAPVVHAGDVALMSAPLFLDIHDSSMRKLAAGRYDAANAPWSTAEPGYRVPPWEIDRLRWRIALHQALGAGQPAELDPGAESWERVNDSVLLQPWVNLCHKLKDALERKELLETSDGSLAYWVWLELHQYPVLTFDRRPGSEYRQPWKATPASLWQRLPELPNDTWLEEARAFLAAVDAAVEWGYAADRTLDDIRRRWALTNFWAPRNNQEYLNEDKAAAQHIAEAEEATNTAHSAMLSALDSLGLAVQEHARTTEPPSPAQLTDPFMPVEPDPAFDELQAAIDTEPSTRSSDPRERQLPGDVAHLFAGTKPIIVHLGLLPITNEQRRKRLFADADNATQQHQRRNAHPSVHPGVALAMHPDVPFTLAVDVVSSAEDAAADIALCDLYSDILTVPPEGWPVTAEASNLLPSRISVNVVHPSQPAASSPRSRQGPFARALPGFRRRSGTST